MAEKAEAAAVSEGESAEMGLEFSVEKEEEKRAKEKTVEGDGVSEERPPGSACGAESGGHAVDITEVGGDDFGWRGVGVRCRGGVVVGSRSTRIQIYVTTRNRGL